MMQREMIIQKLKESGCRITKQRLMLLDIILEEDCSCCKEIYFKASKVDPKIGVATVYRMVNAMEDIGAIKCMRGFQLAGNIFVDTDLIGSISGSKGKGTIIFVKTVCICDALL